MELYPTPFHDWLVELRRHFHRYPELGYREEKTSAKIVEVLKGLGVECRSGVAKTGVVAGVYANNPGPSVAFRADMDAVPLKERNTVEYRSTHDGAMHACGHDGHIAIALGIVRRLIDEDWPSKGCGRAHFIFQPAEEGGVSGARAMIATGLMATEPVKAILAGHMHPELPVGHVGLASGISNAASDNISIKLTGKGGHGAHPHLCTDPIVAGAYLIAQMQSIVSRNIAPTDAAVLTIGKFHAGGARNIIPQDAALEGTLRTLKEEVREKALDRLRKLVQGVESSHGVKAELKIVSGYPPVVNDQGIAQFAAKEAAELLGPDCVHTEAPRMGAEDFAYFLHKWPGAMLRVGCHNPEEGFRHGLHSPYFDFDERALDVGVMLFSRLLTRLTES